MVLCRPGKRSGNRTEEHSENSNLTFIPKGISNGWLYRTYKCRKRTSYY